MKLNNELFELGKSSKEIFTPINEKYGLVTKSMPVVDEDLAKYIKDINDCNEAGINVVRILDYRLIEGTTKAFYDEQYKYTKGVFLEDRAPGNTLEYGVINVDTSEDVNFVSVGKDYLNKVKKYVEELERRAVAPQAMYDKVVSDCLALEDYDLMIDPRPLNFFFDPEKGFSIIDVLTNNNGTKTAKDRMVQLIFGIVYGYGSYDLTIDGVSLEILPKDYLVRLMASYRKIDQKIVKALLRFRYQKDDIRSTLRDLIIRYANDYAACESEEEFIELLKLEYYSAKEKNPVYKM